jgi:hypothetical protein
LRKDDSAREHSRLRPVGIEVKVVTPRDRIATAGTVDPVSAARALNE